MSDNKNARILIVDDVMDNANIVSRVLKVDGYRMAFANSGAEALEMVAKQSFDLILLDILMPEMDGFEVCQHLRATQSTAEIPIIFLTSRTDAGSISRGFEVGGSDYLTKPFNFDELRVRVSNHLNHLFSERKLHTLATGRERVLTMLVSRLAQYGRNLDRHLGGLELSIPETECDCARHLTLAREQLRWLMREILAIRSCCALENRGSDAPLTCTPIATVAAQVLDELTAEAAAVGVELVSSLEPEHAVEVPEDLLRTILHLLVENAIRHNPSGTRVSLDAVMQGGMAMLTLTDNGVGIDPTTQQSLLYDEPDVDAEGLGKLGFYICRKLVAMSGGYLDFDENTDEGASVRIALPRPRSLA